METLAAREDTGFAQHLRRRKLVQRTIAHVAGGWADVARD
jgi:hypothetical protein